MIPHDQRAGDGVMERVGDSKGYRVAHPRLRSSRELGKRRSSVKVTPVFSIHQSDFSFKRTIGNTSAERVMLVAFLGVATVAGMIGFGMEYQHAQHRSPWILLPFTPHHYSARAGASASWATLIGARKLDLTRYSAFPPPAR